MQLCDKYMFLATVHRGRCAYAIWAVLSVHFMHWSPWTVSGKGNSIELYFLSPLLCLSFSRKLFCKQVLTQPGFGVVPVHGCSELHTAAWSGCRCLSCLQHQPKDASVSSRVICSSPAAVSPFGLRTFAWAHAQICCSSKGQRQHSVRKSCIFQAGLGMFVPDGPVCWSQLFLTHAMHIIQVSSFLTLCPALQECILFPDEVTHSPFLLPLLSLFFPLGFNERPTSHGNPSPPVTAAAKVKPGARIVHKYRHQSEGKERTIRAIYFPMHLSAWEKLPPEIAESAAADKLVNRMTGPQLLAISMDKALCVPLCFPISCGLHACEERRDWGRKWLALTSQTHGICIPKVAQHSSGFLFQHLCRL